VLAYYEFEEVEKMWKEGEKVSGAAYAAMTPLPSGLTYVSASDVPSAALGSKCDACPKKEDCPIRPLMEQSQ
jgi:hypothetical protein